MAANLLQQYAQEEATVTSFASHRYIRIGVVGLGGIPEARFQAYLQLLRRFTELPIANLSKPGTWKKEKSPFKYFSWFDGTLLLHFLDRSASALRPSEWQDYQAFRRTWAVIGIVHVPSCAPGAVQNIEKEFQEHLKAFPHVGGAKKVFCFGHLFNEAEGGIGAGGSLESAYRNKEELVIFPPEGDHVDSGMSMVELHMSVMLNDVAVMVLTQLEEEVNKTRASALLKGKHSTLAKRGGQWLAGLRSPFEDEASTSGGESKKGDVGVGGNQGRVSKWVGDLSLLAGTPQDALEAYVGAVGECKAAADPLWQAGALEGWVAAVEVMHAWHLPLEDYLGSGGGGGRDMLLKAGGGADSAATLAKTMVKEIEEKAAEALALLEPTGAPHAPLAVALCLKMAQYHGMAAPTPRYVESLGYIMRAMGVSGLGMPQQILRSLEAASLCHWLGLPRKFAFLLRLAAIQSSELQSFASAHALGRVAAGAYGVKFLDDRPSASHLPTPSPARRDIRAIYPPPPGGWPCLQKHLLSDLIAFSGAARDVTAACGYYLALLHLFAELEEARQRAVVLLGGSGVGGGGGGGGGGGEYYLPSPSSASLGADLLPLGGLGSSSSSAAASSLSRPSRLEMASEGSLGGSGRRVSAPSSASGGQQLRQRSESAVSGGGGGRDEEDSEDDGEYEDEDGDLFAAPGAGGGSTAGSSTSGRPLSSEKWQIRGGMRGGSGGALVQAAGAGAGGGGGSKQSAFSSFSSGGGGFNALKFSFSKNKSNVLKPFRGGSGGGGAGHRGSLSLAAAGGDGTSGGAVGAAVDAATGTAESGGGEQQQQSQQQQRPSSTGGGLGGGIAEGSLLAQNVAPSPEEQEAVILEMMKLTRRLPPRTPLDIHGFPTVHFVRPLRLVSDLVPLLHKHTHHTHAGGGGCGGGAGSGGQGRGQALLGGAASPAGSSAPSSPSAFIYNPFADKAGDGTQTVTWAAGEVAHVALSLSNPLGAPLNIQSIELLVEAANDGHASLTAEETTAGEEHGDSSSSSSSVVAFCYPLTLWIPAYRRHHPLTLALKPLLPGALVIRGVKMTVFNITSRVSVDAHGNGPTTVPRSAPRDWYPRQASPYLRTPKGEAIQKENNKRGGGSGSCRGSGDGSALLSTTTSNAGAETTRNAMAGGGGGGAGPPENAVATNKINVVAPLPCLTTKLDRWATNVELFPGEYRRTSLELQVTNEVSIGFLEISVHQKALTKKQKAAGRPITLYTFGGDGLLPEDGHHHIHPHHHHQTPPRQGQGHRHGQGHAHTHPHTHPHAHAHAHAHAHGHGQSPEGEWLSVALDPLGLDSLTTALDTALRSGSCLSSLFLPLLFRRVDRYPEADIFIKYSTEASHRHHRTLTIPLRFHLKEGLAATDLAVETAAIHIYPALARVIETAHRGVWENSPSPVKRRFKGGMDVIDTDHGECLLLVEVGNGSAEDLHVKTCLLEEEREEEEEEDGKCQHEEQVLGLAVLGASHALCSEVNLLQDLSVPTSMIVRPKASRRVIIPFPRLDASSPLLKPPPPPPPPRGGGQAPKPVITLDSPEWTRALHGLCRSLRMQWADRYGTRSGLLRLPPTLTSTVKPLALERLRRPLLRLSCTVGKHATDVPGAPTTPSSLPQLRKKVSSASAASSSSSTSFTVLPPLSFVHTSPRPPPQHPREQGGPQQQQQKQTGNKDNNTHQGDPSFRLHPPQTRAQAQAAETFPPYAFIPVHFRVINTSSTHPLPPTKCFVHTYQDYGNGNLNFAIDSIRAMWSGSLAWTTPRLAPGETHLHVACVSFTASGTYGIGMSASYLPDAPPVSSSQGKLLLSPSLGKDKARSTSFAAARLAAAGAEAGAGPGAGAGAGAGSEPLIYWGHEAQTLVITEVVEEEEEEEAA